MVSIQKPFIVSLLLYARCTIFIIPLPGCISTLLLPIRNMASFPLPHVKGWHGNLRSYHCLVGEDWIALKRRLVCYHLSNRALHQHPLQTDLYSLCQWILRVQRETKGWLPGSVLLSRSHPSASDTLPHHVDPFTVGYGKSRSLSYIFYRLLLCIFPLAFNQGVSQGH
jgi:hypothetical protein